MFKITLECVRISPDAGPSSAADIEQDFREHRIWHTQPRCTYSDGTITFSAINDFDQNGLALLDEFGDCLSAYLTPHGAVRILSVESS